MDGLAALASVFDAVDVVFAAGAVEFKEDVLAGVELCAADDEGAGAVVEAFGGQGGWAVSAAVVGVEFEGWGDVAFAELFPVFLADGVVDDEAVVLLGDVDVVEFDVDSFGVGVGGKAEGGDREGGDKHDSQSGDDAGLSEDVCRNHEVLHRECSGRTVFGLRAFWEAALVAADGLDRCGCKVIQNGWVLAGVWRRVWVVIE